MCCKSNCLIWQKINYKLNFNRLFMVYLFKLVGGGNTLQQIIINNITININKIILYIVILSLLYYYDYYL